MNIAYVVPWFNSAVTWMRSLNWIEQGLLAACGAIAVFAAGWKPVLSFYDWCLAKYHGKILHLLLDAKRAAHLEHPNENIVLQPIPLVDIAKAAKRSEKRTHWSLRTLESSGKVKETQTGWVLTSA
jgi:hypothetical protein